MWLARMRLRPPHIAESRSPSQGPLTPGSSQASALSGRLLELRPLLAMRERGRLDAERLRRAGRAGDAPLWSLERAQRVLTLERAHLALRQQRRLRVLRIGLTRRRRVQDVAHGEVEPQHL